MPTWLSFFYFCTNLSRESLIRGISQESQALNLYQNQKRKMKTTKKVKTMIFLPITRGISKVPTINIRLKRICRHFPITNHLYLELTRLFKFYLQEHLHPTSHLHLKNQLSILLRSLTLLTITRRKTLKVILVLLPRYAVMFVPSPIRYLFD